MLRGGAEVLEGVGRDAGEGLQGLLRREAVLRGSVRRSAQAGTRTCAPRRTCIIRYEPRRKAARVLSAMVGGLLNFAQEPRACADCRQK